MYVFPSPFAPCHAFTIIYVSLSFIGMLVWEHAFMHIVYHIISQASILVSKTFAPKLCPTCCHAKPHQLAYYRRSSTTTALLQLLFLHVWGPAPIIFRGFCYYVSFVDDSSCYMWLFPLKSKFEVIIVFVSFKKYVETLLNSKSVHYN